MRFDPTIGWRSPFTFFDTFPSRAHVPLKQGGAVTVDTVLSKCDMPRTPSSYADPGGKQWVFLAPTLLELDLSPGLMFGHLSLSRLGSLL